MKLENSDKKKDRLATALFALSVILAAIALLKIGQFFITVARADRLTSGIVAGQTGDPNEIEKYLTTDKEIAKQLKEKNLFAPPKPKKHPVKEVRGILGKEALINGKWYKAGDKINDAEIVAVEPTFIRIKWDGKEKTFAPLAAADSKSPVSVKKKPPKTKKNTTVQAASEKVEQETAPVEEENPLAWLGLDLGAYRQRAVKLWNRLNDTQKGWVKQKWESLPQAQKDQMTQQWENASDDMKQQWFDHMEQNFDQMVNSIQA